MLISVQEFCDPRFAEDNVLDKCKKASGIILRLGKDIRGLYFDRSLVF
jgi:hypothetical protein